jgi:RNA polymerase sigma factor (sigma-70 family)
MLSRSLNSLDWRLVNAIELFQVCAADRENSDAWSELLRRYTPKFRQFIRGTLRQLSLYSACGTDLIASGGIQENDLMQNAIVRLVENDCAAMKRFSGESEDELLAYLAVICRSCVLDSSRRDNALKRRSVPTSHEELNVNSGSQQVTEHPGPEREVLVRELISLTHSIIKSHSGQAPNRDLLVFELHFIDGLSLSQIAQCKGINLSRAGVEKLLKRIIGRVQTIASSGQSEETLQ